MERWGLKRQGYSNRAIARKLGLHRETVKKYLETRAFPEYRVVERKSALEPTGWFYPELCRNWLIPALSRSIVLVLRSDFH